MKIPKLLLTGLLSLALLGCTQQAPASSDATSSPAVSSQEASTDSTSTPAPAESPTAENGDVAQAGTPSFEPVKSGDKMVFTDPQYGYSIAFDGDEYYFNANPQLLQAAREMAGNEMKTQLPQGVGLRFFLFLHEPGTVDFNPNMNCTVEQVPAQAGDLTTDSYMELANKQLKSLLNADITNPGEKVTINGKEFMKADYNFVLKQQNLRLYARAYVHYDAKNKRAYVFTVGTNKEDSGEDFAKLEAPLQTIKIP